MRVAITTLGCKVNQYDSATLETRLRAQGCTIVPFGTTADVYVVNSCSVTDQADAESRQLARRARRINPEARLIVTGCYAQTNPAGASIPEVDHVIGLNRLDDLLRAVRGDVDVLERILVDDLRTARQVRTIGAEVFSGQTRAFLKVQEGCDLFCSFCIVPFSRGRSRSVAPRTVLDQMQVLAARGFREVVLTGVHLGAYGEDLQPMRDLGDLLEMILEHSPIERIRLSSIDPPEVSPRILDLIAADNALCPHLHIPVQSCDDRVLKRMRRRYDSALVRELAYEIRTRLPEAAIGTDAIAGFPGESEDEFATTEATLSELPFTYFHVFPYSRRSGTTAAKLPGHLDHTEVKRRANRLRQLGDSKRADFASRFVGRRLPVLVEEGGAGREVLMGYSRNYQRVEVPGPSSLANQEVWVDVLAARGEKLIGRVPMKGQ
jgi:threonylcarbamoyladenosine tRNA methylthiotransferase MtaB